MADPSWTTFKPLNIGMQFTEDEDGEALGWRIRRTLVDIAKGPDSPVKRHFSYIQDRIDVDIHKVDVDCFEVVCANCQLICWENKKDRAQNLKLLRSSGVVTIDEEGNEVIIRNGEVVDRRPFEAKTIRPRRQTDAVV